MLVLTTVQMKRAEQLTASTSLSYIEMMQNAGTMAYNYCENKYNILTKKSVVVCGKGNNAGDGFVVAKKIHENGGSVSIILCCGESTTTESKQVFSELPIDSIEVICFDSQLQRARDCINSADIVIDAVYGTGFHGDLPITLENIFDAINAVSAVKVALDIPSGMNADTGICANHHLIAETTLVFAAAKPAHVKKQAKEICGEIEVLDIGITNEILQMAQHNAVLLTYEMVAPFFPKRNPNTHKGSYGKFLNISGSKTMCGAAMMSTLSAMRIGAGVTTLATPKCVADICAVNLMEAMTVPLLESQTGSISADAIGDMDSLLSNADACLIGCGLSVTEDTKQVVKYIIENVQKNIVIDADGLNCISKDCSILKKLQKTAILTPHPGEMARLTGSTIEQVKANGYEMAKQFAQRYQVIVVLKGHKTIIATPEGELYVNSTGNAGLAKGGSGDVLAGMIGGLLTQGYEPKNAAIGGVYLHGMVADQLSEQMSQYSMLARDIIEQISYTLKGFESI
ncbi:NAD(P)H-hydrate dehydratase [Paludicola sp. MB14-C6]|uniref:NAD(P)H-hydrate dehydratase n=1 Tax=Paludihabitans sp. MB14-C6 TaxID=3070656 RepID=UPI0027DCBA26|nr:NAD(P)H-hydrate dehydratase [Paludicola sp. MB14-C6]WMJ22138.1 NAD(P)H-hydrate dehydratase [Paludicola sp. MB14-C6]